MPLHDNEFKPVADHDRDAAIETLQMEPDAVMGLIVGLTESPHGDPWPKWQVKPGRPRSCRSVSAPPLGCDPKRASNLSRKGRIEVYLTLTGHVGVYCSEKLGFSLRMK